MRAGTLLALALSALPGAALAQDADPQKTLPQDPAFEAARHGLLPFSREQVLDLRHLLDGDQRARAGVGDPGALVAALSRRINMTFAPGGVTPIVQTAAGYPATISFFDRTGKPWPIAVDANGNPSTDTDPNGFTIRRPVPGGNTIQVTVKGTYPRGGLVVFLEGAPAPLTFMLATGTGSYDARASVHVAAFRPGAEPTETDTAIAVSTGDPAMEAMLQGITPPGAKSLAVAGASPDEVRAWRLGQDLFVRANYPLLAPEPTAHVFAEGGMRIYRLPINTSTGDMSLSMAAGSRNTIVRVRTN